MRINSINNYSKQPMSVSQNAKQQNTTTNFKGIYPIEATPKKFMEYYKFDIDSRFMLDFSHYYNLIKNSEIVDMYIHGFGKRFPEFSLVLKKPFETVFNPTHVDVGTSIQPHSRTFASKTSKTNQLKVPVYVKSLEHPEYGYGQNEILVNFKDEKAAEDAMHTLNIESKNEKIPALAAFFAKSI